MADWTTITDSQVDPRAPVTSELMNALRDNPISIAENSTDAPKIADKVVYGTGSSVDFASLDDYSGLFFDISVDSGVTNVDIEVDVSTDGGSTYGSTLVLRTAGTNKTNITVMMRGYLNFSDGQVYATGLEVYEDTGAGDPGISIGLTVNDVVPSASEDITNVRFSGEVSVFIVPQGGQSAS